jgi:ribosomal-protein-alanine N-acetyltransferase
VGAVRLERMRWWHIDQLMPIEADLFGNEQWSAAMFWNELANGNFYLVAVEADGEVPIGADRGVLAGVDREVLAGGAEGEIIGYAGLSVIGHEAWVQNIAVRKDRQRYGIGRALLEALLDEARARGARTVLLEVAVDNGPAQRMYDRYGFDTVGIRRGYYQPSNTDALVMRRDL